MLVRRSGRQARCQRRRTDWGDWRRRTRSWSTSWRVSINKLLFLRTSWPLDWLRGRSNASAQDIPQIQEVSKIYFFNIIKIQWSKNLTPCLIWWLPPRCEQGGGDEADEGADANSQPNAEGDREGRSQQVGAGSSCSNTGRKRRKKRPGDCQIWQGPFHHYIRLYPGSIPDNGGAEHHRTDQGGGDSMQGIDRQGWFIGSIQNSSNHDAFLNLIFIVCTNL